MVVQGRKLPKPKPVERPPPTSRITKIASLKRFPDKDYANSILHDVAKLVAPIMHENHFKVGLLCEMYPKSGNLLGLNVNKGQKIMLRLRYHSNDRLFLPMGDIIGTMLHELTHNLYGPHDAKFYKFLDDLKQRFEEVQYNPRLVQGYICEENKLGGNTTFGGYQSIRDKRLKVMTKKLKTETRKLGGITKPTRTMRELVLEAVERRLKDSKWCNSHDQDDAEPDTNELDIIDVDLVPHGTANEIIDLTDDVEIVAPPEPPYNGQPNRDDVNDDINDNDNDNNPSTQGNMDIIVIN